MAEEKWFEMAGRLSPVRPVALDGDVLAPARGRMVGGELVPTPWRGRFGRWEVRGGLRVPLEGEVAWILGGGEWPYWRGRIVDAAYEFVE